MDEPFKDPNKIKPSRKGKEILFSFAGTLSAIIRTAIDLINPVSGLRPGTLPEWIKAIKIENTIESEAYYLLTLSLIKAIQKQLRPRFVEIRKNKENTVYFYAEREILFVSNDIRNAIDQNDYILNITQFDEPQSFELVTDFQDFYKDWITESFPISKEHANDLAVDFPDYFAYEFQMELGSNSGDYPKLLMEYNNPFNNKIKLLLDRRQYKSELKALYNMKALGEDNVSLSDVYIEPNFLVYEAIFSEDQKEKLKVEFNTGDVNFLPTGFGGSIHDYFEQHFLTGYKSEEINHQVEESRMLILLGQPGHGKSSFCYHSLYKLLSSNDFKGDVFYLPLREAHLRILDDPIDGLDRMMDNKIKFQDWIFEEGDKKKILFLDGLDELLMTQGLSDEDVRQFLQSCRNLLKYPNHQNLYLVITSRFHYVEFNQLYKNCLLFSLDTLNLDQQLQLVKNYNDRSVGTSNLSENLLKDINKKRQFKHIKELIRLPILLQMFLISELKIEGKNFDVATSKAAIYNKLFTTVLNRKWDKDRKLQAYHGAENFETEDLRRYLAFLAYKIFQHNKGYLNRNQLLSYQETQDFVEDRLGINKDDGQLKDVLKGVLTAFYIKESKKVKQPDLQSGQSREYAIEFLHKSLYEYLACEHLWKSILRFFLAQEPGSSRDYLNNRVEDVQARIQELFAHTRMTTDTVEHLKGIIAQNTEDHGKLLQRMAKFLPKLLKFGFLANYSIAEPSIKRAYLPEQQALNVFYNYWLILGSLNWQKVDVDNFMKKDQKDRIRGDLLEEIETSYHAGLVEMGNMSRTAWSREMNLEKEKSAFSNWLRNEDKPKQSQSKRQHFLAWVSHFLMRKEGLSSLEFLIDAIKEVRPSFVRQIRLLSAERMPMQLPLYFAPLEGVDLVGLLAHSIILYGANLKGADLRNANLRGANLRYVNFINADLRGANLIKANLHNAILSNTDLWDANLNYATLKGADLSYAHLKNVTFRGANLSNANLMNASVDRPDWFSALSAWKIKGYNEIVEKYIVSQDMKEYIDKFGNVYIAYLILPKETE